MNFRSKILFFACILFAFACVEPFEIDFDGPFQIILVEAALTDEDIQQKINISNSYYDGDNPYKSPISGLKVEILVNEKFKISLKDVGEGFYVFPENFRAKNGDVFQLFFQNADGKQYKSKPEQLTKSPEIDRIFDVFEKEGTTKFGRIAPSNNIYIDFTDNASDKNYYSWSWTLWERQFVCLTTDFYDLYCNRDCYEILNEEELNIMSDAFYNGKKVTGKLVAKIPYYQYDGALVEIKQQAISFEAYKFYKQLEDLAQKTGTLAETPPQIVGGNISNVADEKEQVVGMFTVKGISSKYYWLDRENAKGKAIPIGLIGRKPISPSGGNITAPCISSKNKTPIKPKNWLN